MPLDLQPVLTHVDEKFDESVQRLRDFLSIASISTDSDYDKQTRQAAEWAADVLRSTGFRAESRETPGQPMVVAHHDGPPGYDGPRLLYYGHYDVQPPDPLELWNSPPFEPTVVDGPHGKRIVARGAVDDKGQVMTFLEAFRAWQMIHGTLPCPVTVMLEGEEESGSPSLDGFLEKYKDDLAADVCVVSDTGMWDIDTPAITYMLRGLVYIEATLHGPSHDLHSGMYGGSVLNPINALCEILGELKDESGVIAIPGFYDDVAEPGEEEKTQWERLSFDVQEFLASGGMHTPVGEKDRSTLERVWSRPTCDINGMYGGYTGKGAKTVIASQATAKLSCRLVAEQNPRKIHEKLIEFFQQRTPPDCRWEFLNHGMNPAIRVPTDSPYLQNACSALEKVFDRSPVLIGSGGSIPAVGAIQRILGIDSLLVGFGLDDDRVHSPNEKFELRCLHNGISSHATLLNEIGAMRV